MPGPAGPFGSPRARSFYSSTSCTRWWAQAKRKAPWMQATCSSRSLRAGNCPVSALPRLMSIAEHRKGCRTRTSLPDRARRPAECRGHHFDPARPERTPLGSPPTVGVRTMTNRQSQAAPDQSAWWRALMSGSTCRSGPWEASGTNGMKVLLNGGLNFSQFKRRRWLRRRSHFTRSRAQSSATRGIRIPDRGGDIALSVL